MRASNMLCSQALSSVSEAEMEHRAWVVEIANYTLLDPQISGTYIKVRVLTVQPLLTPASVLFRSTPCVPVPVIWFHRRQSKDST